MMCTRLASHDRFLVAPPATLPLQNVSASRRSLSRRSRSWPRCGALIAIMVSCLQVGLVAGLLLALPPSLIAAEPASSVTTPDTSAAFFDQRVAPLLLSKCVECHHGAEPAGGLDLSSRASIERGGESGSALNADDPLHALLIERVRAGEMPPKKPLSAAEVAVLEQWLKEGAVWSGPALDPLARSTSSRAGYDWWSLQPVRGTTLPVPPAHGSTAWDSPIDAFVEQARTAHGLTPSVAADRRTLARRLYDRLLGLLPSPEEVEEFVRDESPDAVERLTDRLLASPHYGERWARHWLDVIRFGESNGFERDLPRPQAWHYRDWVIRALNRDLPYDEFIRQQIAADQYAPDDEESWSALGFLVAGAHDTVLPASDRMRAAMRQDEMEDLVGTIGQAFLGLTVNCARCHDHKFDPITQREYFQLTAALTGVDHTERQVRPRAVTDRLNALNARRSELLERQSQVQEAALARLDANADEDPPTEPTQRGKNLLVRPIAEWIFTRSLTDAVQGSPVELHGGARQTPEGLVLEGPEAYASSALLPMSVRTKTLEVRVRLANLDQRGGAAISLQTANGAMFDGIVFGELQPGRWMPGSDGFRRTAPLEGAVESHQGDEPICMTYVYHEDGRVTAYRDGQLYGHEVQTNGPVTFEPQSSQVLFGLRHSPSQPGKHLAGTIVAARVYGTALTADQVSASAAKLEFQSMAASRWIAALSEAEAAEWQSLARELGEVEAESARLLEHGTYAVYTAALSNPAPGSTRVLRRGDVSSPGEVVGAAGLAAISRDWAHVPAVGQDDPEGHRRRWLAEWLSSQQNGPFARTMANRLWHYTFGRGLVATPNDLGFNGGQSSHPELHEWLAQELSRREWSLKQFHRVLLSSQTFRQASQARPELLQIDHDNVYLWRYSPQRREAEAVRDAMLQVAGVFNDGLYGPSYEDFHSHFFKGTQFYDPRPETPATWRRTLYRMWARSGRNPLLDVFDCPDPSVTTPKRASTTTPLQALALLNNNLVWSLADAYATQQTANTVPSTTQQVEGLFLVALQRRPSDEELRAAESLVREHGLAALCRILFNASEFLYVE